MHKCQLYNERRIGRVTQPAQSNGGVPGQRNASQDSIKRCFICNKVGHLKKDCRQNRRPEQRVRTNQVREPQQQEPQPATCTSTIADPLTFLQSSSDEEIVHQIRVSDKGSLTQCVKITVQGVPVYGIIDSGADITIIGGRLFKRVALAVRLKKKDFMKPDKTPRIYDQKPFTLDGKMDLDVVFEYRAMRTSVYIKMDAHDQLLLSEGVCRQLGIISYHSKVERWIGGFKQSAIEGKAAVEAKVPTVKVQLVRTVRLLPHQSVTTTVLVSRSHTAFFRFYLWWRKKGLVWFAVASRLRTLHCGGGKTSSKCFDLNQHSRI